MKYDFSNVVNFVTDMEKIKANKGIIITRVDEKGQYSQETIAIKEENVEAIYSQLVAESKRVVNFKYEDGVFTANYVDKSKVDYDNVSEDKAKALTERFTKIQELQKEYDAKKIEPAPKPTIKPKPAKKKGAWKWIVGGVLLGPIALSLLISGITYLVVLFDTLTKAYSLDKDGGATPGAKVSLAPTVSPKASPISTLVDEAEATLSPSPAPTALSESAINKAVDNWKEELNAKDKIFLKKGQTDLMLASQLKPVWMYLNGLVDEKEANFPEYDNVILNAQTMTIGNIIMQVKTGVPVDMSFLSDQIKTSHPDYAPIIKETEVMIKDFTIMQAKTGGKADYTDMLTYFATLGENNNYLTAPKEVQYLWNSIILATLKNSAIIHPDYHVDLPDNNGVDQPFYALTYTDGDTKYLPIPMNDKYKDYPFVEESQIDDKNPKVVLRQDLLDKKAIPGGIFGMYYTLHDTLCGIENVETAKYK